MGIDTNKRKDGKAPTSREGPPPKKNNYQKWCFCNDLHFYQNIITKSKVKAGMGLLWYDVQDCTFENCSLQGRDLESLWIWRWPFLAKPAVWCPTSLGQRLRASFWYKETRQLYRQNNPGINEKTSLFQQGGVSFAPSKGRKLLTFFISCSLCLLG